MKIKLLLNQNNLFILEDLESKHRFKVFTFCVGTGKTITGIAVTGALFKSGRIRRALVVAPLSILGVWDEEFSKFAGFDYTLAVLTGGFIGDDAGNAPQRISTAKQGRCLRTSSRTCCRRSTRRSTRRITFLAAIDFSPKINYNINKFMI